ncbi:hypothetical protein LEP1GSC044_1444 [Leptospira kirschneri serovar Grippotyphosa str. RM52]|nr:hypothetical protein LEP1GSC044_1444 [Leptospira kirschneri serovar Grippotyphosa str. RM52]
MSYKDSGCIFRICFLFFLFLFLGNSCNIPEDLKKKTKRESHSSQKFWNQLQRI